MYGNTIRSAILKRMQSRKKTNVFLRSDFADLGSYAQVGRAIRELRAEGRLVKIGYGLYARAKKSKFTGNIVPEKSLTGLAYEALGKLGIQAGLGSAAVEYNSGQTTQVPGQTFINVGSARITRTIGFDNRVIGYETNNNRRIGSNKRTFDCPSNSRSGN